MANCYYNALLFLYPAVDVKSATIGNGRQMRSIMHKCSNHSGIAIAYDERATTEGGTVHDPSDRPSRSGWRAAHARICHLLVHLASL